MRLEELNFKRNSAFICILFFALSLELIAENIGVHGAFLPNFTLCIVFSFGYLKPISLWIVAIAVIVSESFFSTTPTLMSFLIILSYFTISFFVGKGGFRQRNFHVVIFLLFTIVIYSTKILWLFLNNMRPEVNFIMVKMLMTILFFPLFYISINKFLKLY